MLFYNYIYNVMRFIQCNVFIYKFFQSASKVNLTYHIHLQRASPRNFRGIFRNDKGIQDLLTCEAFYRTRFRNVKVNIILVIWHDTLPGMAGQLRS